MISEKIKIAFMKIIVILMQLFLISHFCKGQALYKFDFFFVYDFSDGYNIGTEC